MYIIKLVLLVVIFMASGCGWVDCGSTTPLQNHSKQLKESTSKDYIKPHLISTTYYGNSKYGPFSCIAISRSGRIIVVGTDLGWILSYDSETGQCLKKIHFEESITWNASCVKSLNITPDEKRIVASGKMERVFDGQKQSMAATQVINMDSNKVEMKAYYPHWQMMRSDMSEDGQKYLCYYSSEVMVYSTERGELIKRIKGDSDIAFALFSHDGKYIAIMTNSTGNHIKIYDTNLYEVVYTYNTDHDGPDYPVSALTYSPDDKYLLTGDTRGLLVKWTFSSGETQTINTAAANRINDMKISYDGKFIVATRGKIVNGVTDDSAFWQSELVCYDAGGNECVTSKYFDEAMLNIVFVPNSHTLITTGKVLRKWKVSE